MPIVLIWGSISKTANVIWNVLEHNGLYQKTILWICLLLFFPKLNNKSKISFLQTLVLVLFFSFNIPLAIVTLKKILWKNYKILEMELTMYPTPQLAQSLFSGKSNLKFCFTFNMISFVNAQGLVKIKLACSKVLLLIN